MGLIEGFPPIVGIRHFTSFPFSEEPSRLPATNSKAPLLPDGTHSARVVTQSGRPILRVGIRWVLQVADSHTIILNS